MARIILFCNGVRINSIADLYDNFNFEDLKISLTSGKLQYWLTTNGFSVECEAVEKIDCNAFDADIQIMRALKYPDEKQNAYLEEKRLQAEKAEAEKKALEEAKRLQAEKAEAEKKALEEAKRLQAEKKALEEAEKKALDRNAQGKVIGGAIGGAIGVAIGSFFDLSKKLTECNQEQQETK